MVGIAQLVELMVVVHVVAGSSPVSHPSKTPIALAIGVFWTLKWQTRNAATLLSQVLRFCILPGAGVDRSLSLVAQAPVIKTFMILRFRPRVCVFGTNRTGGEPWQA